MHTMGRGTTPPICGGTNYDRSEFYLPRPRPRLALA